MSGFDGRIIFEGNRDRAKQLLGTAIKHAAVQRENKNILGLSSSIRTYNLGGGASCVISDLGHMRTMHIVAPGFVEEEQPYFISEHVTGPAGPGVYDVLAGFTDAPIIDTHEVTDKQGKKMTVKALRKFTPTTRTNARYPSDTYRRLRLAVPQNPIFAKVGDDSGIEWSEHMFCKPANYSGSMRMVVQLLMGLGKVLRPTAEQKMKLKPLPPYGTHVIDGGKVPMESAFGLYKPEVPGAPTPMARVNFDYRHAKTHGVIFDGDGVPWVLEIAMRGVHAMRLYMDPVSMTKEGRERWLKVSPELEEFLSIFPGIPIGFTVPSFEEFDKYKRAGEVVELISQSAMRDYYSKIQMNTESGWCFSFSGKEAHNTCYTYGIDEVIQASHFKIGASLTGERFAAWTPARSTLSQKFTLLYEYNKCRRMSESDAEKILYRYEKDGNEAGYKEFDKFVVKPTLVGSAKMTIQKAGKLYHPAKFKGQPQIKFPEPDLGGLLSFDFSDASFPRKPKKVKCDTPMYVCFINNTLEVINYAFDNTKEEKMEEASYSSTRQECQAVGEWVNTSTDAGIKLMRGNFYSNRWDFRHTITGAASTISNCKGTKLGADALYRQDHPFSTGVTAETNVHFWIECETYRTTQIPSFGLSTAVPFHDRCAYYFAMEGAENPKTRSRSGGAEHYKAKVTEQWELYNFIWAWFGSIGCPVSEWIDDGPRNCHARKRCRFENENACFDDYMIGDMWLEACPMFPNQSTPPTTGDSMIGNWARGPIYPQLKIPSEYSETMPDTPGSWSCDVYFVNSTDIGEQRLKNEQHTYEQGVTLDQWWWRASPDDSGAMAFIGAGCSCLGSQVTNVMDDMFGVTKHFGGPETMYTGYSSCYTGVIE